MLIAEAILIQIDLATGAAIGTGLGGGILGAAKLLVSYLTTRDANGIAANAALYARMEGVIAEHKESEREAKEERKENMHANITTQERMVTAMIDMKNALLNVDSKVVEVIKRVDGVPCANPRR